MSPFVPRRFAHLIALTILLNATPVLCQCSAVATSAVAPNVGGFIYGTTSGASYAFAGQTAPANGLFCDGCAKGETGYAAPAAGNWWTVSDVASGATASAAGIFCPSSGGTCSSVAAGATASSAGKFYRSTAIASGAVASETGALCPTSSQAASPPNTCAAVATGATATNLGSYCVGSTASCSATINGAVTTTNGVYCGGCVYKLNGETANTAGTWWTVASIASGSTAPSAGIFCPSDGTACSSVASGATASVTGNFYSSTSVTQGATAGSNGVLCPASATSSGAIVTTSQGTAIGSTATGSNSAFKAASSPLLALITAFAIAMTVFNH